MNKKLKRFAIVILVISVLLFIVSIFIKKAPVDVKTRPLSSGAGVSNSLVNTSTKTSSNDEFSSLLTNIKQISIDTSLFENKAYQMLRDFPVSLGTDVVGRNNPFAPIGVETDDSPNKTTVATIQTGKITSTTAEFGGQVTLADTVPASIVFEYGLNESFGFLTTPVPVAKNTTVLVTVNKLVPETTYFVRAIVVQGSSNIIGNTTTFNTNKK